MARPFSYGHLYYFWVVVKEGGIARGAARLDMAVQTVSSQVHALERALGAALLRPAGRRLVLTDAGATAFRQAEQIFQLGEQLPAIVHDAIGSPIARLAVGISEGLPKVLVQQLLEPVMHVPNLRLHCFEHDFEDLLGDLALHRLDVVLADRAAPPNPNLKLFSHSLGSPPVVWYAAKRHYAARKKFPHCLTTTPVLMPTRDCAVRARLDGWFERHAIAPRIVGEFEDSALLATFGASGMGVFAAPEAAQDDLTLRYGVRPIGSCDGVHEHLFAIGTERKVIHPLVQRVLAEATK
jgi:LysR family transcriptional activator of nhaA